MSTLAAFSRLVTARPWLTVTALVVITFALAAGAGLRALPPSTEATLPDGPVRETLDRIDEVFGDSGEASAVTLIFRGEALTPAGLAQMSGLIDEITSDLGVAELLVPENPIFAPSLLVQTALQVADFGSVSQAEIDSVRDIPQINAGLTALAGSDADGTPVSIAVIHLRGAGDDRVAEAERQINALATANQGPLSASSISPIVIEDEYREATEVGMLPVTGLALLLIVALLVLFLRTAADVLLTLAGLVMALVWIIGVEGLLGPNALGLTGPPNSLTALVPIIIISLTVDYALQIVTHYREQRTAGEPVINAIRTGLRIVTVPLTLAAITTMVSLFASLFSPIGIVGDFGVIAGLGVGLSLIVMLTLLPAGRTIIDRRLEARGTLNPPRPVSQAFPGIEKAAGLLGRSVTNRPAPYIVGVLAVTAALGYAATGIESEFSIRDILPRGGAVLEDMNTLDEAVGGSTELATVLIEAEATETRTLLNLRDLTAAFGDEATRPGAAAGPILATYELLVRDWTSDSGEPGDKYDPELASLFAEASTGVDLDPALMQEFLDRLEVRDPAVGRVLINNPDGVDSILLQFSTYTDERAQTQVLQDEIEAVWHGNDDVITATSWAIISITVTDSISARQTESITTTVAVAITVLAVFFWVTLRQPFLAIVAVGPIVLVLISVLGTMALLGIPYTLITSIITALSIGIGVDYTIHVIHRYREEFARFRNPETAAVRTLSTTGSALLGSGLTTALGLGMLVAAPLAASQQFGFTAAITIFYSLVFSILLVPPAMTIWGAYQNMRLRSMVERMWGDLDVAIEEIHKRHEQGQAST